MFEQNQITCDEKSVKTEIKKENKTILMVNQKNANAKYFKDSKLNGKDLKCYVDMGCDVVALREDIAREIGFSFYETKMDPSIGYGNGCVEPLGVATEFLSIDNVSVKVEVYIVPKDAQ